MHLLRHGLHLSHDQLESAKAEKLEVSDWTAHETSEDQDSDDDEDDESTEDDSD